MKNIVKKGILSVSLIGIGQVVVASEIDLTTHGRLSAGYFGGAYNGKQSFSNLALNAYITADFGLNENWNIGVGAAGIWDALSIFVPQTSLPYTSNGDVADLYLVYKNDDLKVVAGRYNLDVGTTAMSTSTLTNGPIQGISVQWDSKGNHPYRLWLHYINSFLDNGYLPGRIGSDLAMLNPYFSNGKIKLGGEVVLFGADYRSGGMLLSPWILINTKAPDGTTKIDFNPLFLIGGTGIYNYKFNPNWLSITTINLTLQYGNMGNDKIATNNVVGFASIDEEVKYARNGVNKAGKPYELYSISVGGGARSVMAEKTTKLFGINDRTRFYGRFINGASTAQGGTWTVYLFGKMSHSLFEAQLLMGYGSYIEVSAVGLWKAYRQKRNSNEGSFLGFDIGGGYVYSNGVINVSNQGLMAFAKLSY